MDMSQTEWKKTGEQYSQPNAACNDCQKTVTSAMERRVERTKC